MRADKWIADHLDGPALSLPRTDLKTPAGARAWLLLWLIAVFPAGATSQVQRLRNMAFQPPVRPPEVQQPLGMTFSQDGSLGALRSKDRIILLDTSNWQTRSVQFRPGITALAFSHDSVDLAIARSDCRYFSPIGEPRDQFVEISILKVASGTIARKVTESRVGVVHDLAYTADGTLVAVAGYADPGRPRQPNILAPDPSISVDDVLLWNVSAQRFTSVLPEGKSRTLQGFFWGFSPSGSTVAFSLLQTDRDRVGHGEVRIFNAAAGSLLRTVQKSYAEVARPLSFSSDSRFLAFDSNPWTGSFATRIYDTTLRKLVRNIKKLPIPIGWLAPLDSGKILVSTGFRNYPAFVDVAPIWHESVRGTGRLYILDNKGSPEKRFDVDRAYLAGKLVPKKNLFATFGGNVLTLYDLGTGEPRRILIDGSSDAPPTSPGQNVKPTAPESPQQSRMVSAHRILALSFLSGRRAVACAGDDGILRIWDLVKGNEIESMAVADTHPIALSESGASAQPQNESEVVVSDRMGGTVSYRLDGIAGKIVSLAFSAGGEWLAAGTDNGSICVWPRGHPEPQFVLKGHKGAVNSLAISRELAVLASGGDDKTVRLWDLSAGHPLQVLKGHSKRVLSLAFGPDRNSLASGGEDSAVIIWDVARRRTGKRFLDPNGPVRSLCFSPDGSELVSGGNRSLRRWDVSKRKLIGVLIFGQGDRRAGRWSSFTSGFLESIMVMSFSPDGEVLACGCTNNSLLVWDTKTWEGKVLIPSGEFR